MGEEEGFVEGGLRGLRLDGEREAGEGAHEVEGFAVEGQGDETGSGGEDGDVELVGEVVGEGGGTEFGDGEAAGGDDEGGGGEGFLVGLDLEGAGAGDGGDGAGEEELNLGGFAFGSEHGDDLAGGAVAEELAEGLFVVGDFVALDLGDEVVGGVAVEGGGGEAGVLGDEAVGGGVDVGEVAAPAAGYEDFGAGFGAVVDEGGATAALGGGGGAHHPCGAGADNQHVKGMLHGGSLKDGGGGGNEFGLS